MGLFGSHFCVFAEDDVDVANELNRVDHLVAIDPQQARTALAKLESRRSRFDQPQTLHFQLLNASVLGYFNLHQDRVAYVTGFIDAVQDPDIKSKFLYQLSVSYVALGQYEPALDVMNTSVALLPRVTDTIAKMDTLQSAVILLNALHAYDEALSYANRMYDIPGVNQDLRAKCIAAGDRAEIYKFLNRRSLARAQMREAVELCDRNGWTYVSVVVKALAAIDLIDNEEYETGIAAGLPVIRGFPSSMLGVDYVSDLEEALARAYLRTGRLPSAEQYGLLAYQHASSQKLVQQTEKSLETLEQIKRAQGQYSAALDYAERALIQKNALLDDRLQKNIAYQRVKFSMQDQSNQVSLLEKKNKILAIEKQLEKKNSENLWLILVLAFFIVTALGVYLWKVTLQKNFFRRTTQIDGLTRIANRSHFIASADRVVTGRTGFVSLIVFDMDFFKLVNDSFGHAAGDWVLSAVCQIVSAELRKGDLFGRLGGEEFAICLPNTDAPTALQLAQRCREVIATIDSSPCGFQFDLSASFGVATMGLDDLGTYADLLEAADKALYQAKSDGRNCVAVHS